MFSFRRDKVGFFVTLILILIAAATLISTIVLVWVGLATGSWWAFLALKIVVASAWVLCITTVLIRVGIFRVQMLKAEKARLAANGSQENANGPVVPLPPAAAGTEGANGTMEKHGEAQVSSSRPQGEKKEKG